MLENHLANYEYELDEELGDVALRAGGLPGGGPRPRQRALCQGQSAGRGLYPGTPALRRDLLSQPADLFP